MHRLFDFFIERWKVAFSITGVCFVLGIFALTSMQKQTFPPVNTGQTSIITLYPGSSATESNQNVTQPIEDELRGVDGFKDLTSISQAGLSRIVIRTDIDNYDTDEVFEDIQEALSKVNTLPDGVLGNPSASEAKSSEFPVMRIAITGPEVGRDLDEIADRIKDRLENVRGVARVLLEGFSPREFHILLDPNKMRRFNVGVQEVVKAVSKRVQDIPAGDIELEDQVKLVRVTGKVEELDRLKEIIIRSNFEGDFIKVGDLARVEDAFQDKALLNQFNGKSAISSVIIKKEKADTLDVVARVEPILKDFEQQLSSDYGIRVFDNEAERVENILSIAVGNAIIGFLLVAVFLLLFFPSLSGVLTALSLPTVVMLTLGLMPMLGADFNRITLLAIIICLGLLVDNSIVIGENYIRLRKKGLDCVDAAKAGVKQFWIPITATALTTIAAFLPMLVTKGVMGDFIRFIPIIVTLALMVSLFESFMLLPARLRFSMRGVGSKESRPKKSLFERIESVFEAFMKIVLRFRYVALTLGAGVVVGAFFVQAKLNYFDVFPKRDVESYFARVEGEPGWLLRNTLNEAQALADRAKEEITKEFGDDTVQDIVVSAGSTQEAPVDIAANFGDHVGSVRLIVPLDRARQINTDNFIAALRRAGKGDFKEVAWSALAMGPPVGKALEVTLGSDQHDALNKAVEEFKDILRPIPGVFDVADDQPDKNNEINFDVNEKLLSSINLSYDELGIALRSSLEGSVVAGINVDGKNIGVRVRNDDPFRSDVSNVLNTNMLNAQGRLIPIRNVASIDEVARLPKIKRYEYARAITVSANVDNDQMNSVQLNSIAEKEIEKLKKKYPEVNFFFLGQAESTKESMQSLLQALLLAALGIFLILLFLFDSFLIPLVVLASIPMGLVGVFLAFYLHSLPLSFFAIVGIVGLAGVVVNGAIILISYAGDLKKEKKLQGHELLARATRDRLKPVLVTTLTTVGGLLPTAYSLGGHDSSLIPLTLSMGWGLVSGTFMVLLLTPCMLAVVEDFEKLMGKFSKRFS